MNVKIFQSVRRISFRIKTKLYVRWIVFYKPTYRKKNPLYIVSKTQDIKIMNNQQIFYKDYNNKWVSFKMSLGARELIKARFYPYRDRLYTFRERARIEEERKAQKRLKIIIFFFYLSIIIIVIFGIYLGANPPF